MPPGSAKTQVSLRLNQDAIAAFRGQDTGWQSRMNEALRKAAGVWGRATAVEQGSAVVVIEHNLDVIK